MLDSRAFLNFLIVFQVQLTPLFLLYSSSPHASPPPTLHPTPFGFVHLSFIHVSWWPFLYFPHYPSSPSPLVTISLFFISMSLFIFCLLICFVDQVLHIGEVISYLSFTAWLISLNIKLSDLSMLLQRVGAPSFFLLHSIPLSKCTTAFWSTHLLMGT